MEVTDLTSPDFNAIVSNIKTYLSTLCQGWRLIADVKEETIFLFKSEEGEEGDSSFESSALTLAGEGTQDNLNEKDVKVEGVWLNESINNDEDKRRKSTFPVSIQEAEEGWNIEDGLILESNGLKNELLPYFDNENESGNSCDKPYPSKSSDTNSSMKKSIQKYPDGILCTNCNTRYPNKAGLNNHRSYRKRYKCKICFLDICSSLAAMEHAAVVHGSVKNEEDEDVTAQEDLESKVMMSRVLRSRKRWPNGPSCVDCKCHFVNFAKYAKHLQSRKKWKCKICNKELCYEVIARKHAANFHGSTFKCDKCDYVGKSEHFLKRHIHDIHEPPTVQCPECPEKFPTNRYLGIHMANKHGADRKIYYCKLCPKTFLTYAGMHLHNNSVHLKLIHCCDKCPKKFSSKGPLQKHIKTKHEGEMLQCDECPRRFEIKARLREHIDFAHRNGGYQCPICDRKFMLTSHLKRHIYNLHEKNRIGTNDLETDGEEMNGFESDDQEMDELEMGGHEVDGHEVDGSDVNREETYEQNNKIY